MTRWHLLRKGRIVESVDTAGEPEAAFGYTRSDELIVSDADFRAIHYRRVLLARERWA